MMMEAMRILKVVYPNPKRTILAAHWSGEEQGLNGSGAFAADHPEIVSRLQVLINQDSGTGRAVKISMQGFTGAGAFFRRWLSQMPNEMSRQISLVDPGTQDRGTDHFSFACHGAPAFELSSVGWDYEAYTWHTNRDTFDKIVFDDLNYNARLIAMLAYLASEDPERVPRERAASPTDPKTGKPSPWPACIPPISKFLAPFLFSRSLLLLSRRRVLHVLIEPIDAFRKNVQQRFAAGVAVRFEGQGFVADGCALAFQRHVEAL